MSPQQLAQEVENLFTLPDVAIRLNNLIDQPDTSIKDLVEVVQLDAAISATVLRLANSAWYGLPSKVDTISRAIVRGLVQHHARERGLELSASGPKLTEQGVTLLGGLLEDAGLDPAVPLGPHPLGDLVQATWAIAAATTS